jgi:hypothetical protein
VKHNVLPCSDAYYPLQKRANGIPLNTIEYHSVSFNTIGPFNDISVELNGNLKYHSISLNGTKNPKYHSNTIQIPLKYPWTYYPLVPFNGI